jgi:dipeptidyl aminopeptidase/acylaminoacyl peptidase
MSRLFRLAAAALFLSAGCAAARPFTLDDLVKVESLEGAYLAPGDRWLAVQRTAPYDSARAYDDDTFEAMALGRIDLVDIEGDGVPWSLGADDAGEGLTAGPFSPDGRWMAVFRLRDHDWELGLVELATRGIHWLGLTVEPSNWGRTVQWRSAGELVAIATAAGDKPGRFNRVWAAEARPPARWATARAGRIPTDTAVGSGAYLSLTPQGPRAELVRIEAASGVAHVLARGTFIDLEIAPDGRYVAALGEAAPRQPRPGDRLNTGTMARRRGLMLVDLTTGAVSRPCGDLDTASHLLSWSPKGDRLLVFGREDVDWTAGTLRDVRPRSGDCPSLRTEGFAPALNEDPMEGFPVVRADWMGQDPLVLGEVTDVHGRVRQDWRRLTAAGPVNLTARLTAPPQALLAVDPTGLLVANQAGVWRVDRRGAIAHLGDHPVRPIAPAEPGGGDRLSYVAPRQAFAWVRDGAQVGRVSAAGIDKSQRLPPGAQPLLATGDLVIARASDAHGITTLIAQRGGRARPLETINTAYGDITFSAPREITYTGRDGVALKAWLYLPPGQASGAKAPLVVIPYPGAVYPTPPRAYAPGFPFTEVNPHVLNAAGYGVLIPSMPRDWSDHEPAAGLADQVLAATDAAVATGAVDPGRLALWGHSFGGYAALAIATQTGRFRSVIEAAGKSDLISAYGPFLPQARSAPEDGISPISTMGWMENGQGNLGLAPAQDIARYARNSPAFHADRITAPVLMIHGDLDFVPLAQGEEMFSAIYRQHKDAVLVTLWGEGHTATSPANIRRMYDWILWWLDTTLRDRPTAPPSSGSAAPPTTAAPRTP